MHTFLWHDYETFGIDARSDRPAQFAAIRTDAELNEIGNPVMLYCQPAKDYLPDPQSCLVTGITPQVCEENGVPENEFAAQIEALFSKPNTIGVGYNSIRFDDEFTRFLFWRNLIDPYAREWQNGCGRWDILDLVRTAYALRPEGIVWPKHEDGRPSFRLEDLAKANNIIHDAAHDALSDVRATIGLAKLIREKQPRLFDYCLGLRDKNRVADEIGVPQNIASAQPFLHVSGMFPVERGCLAVMLPLGMHPTNRNEVIAWDLSQDPSVLLDLDAQTIRERLFTKTEDLPEGVSRLPIKTIRTNRSPVVIGNLKTLSAQRAEHWGVDLTQAQAHAAIAESAGMARQFAGMWQDVFTSPEAPSSAPDVDGDLYGGFLSRADRRQLDAIRRTRGEDLTGAGWYFDDARLETLLFRYRARNFPASLLPEEREAWGEHCAQRLQHGKDGARTGAQLRENVAPLMPQANAAQASVLHALLTYADSLLPTH